MRRTLGILLVILTIVNISWGHDLLLESNNYFRVVEESGDTVKFFPFGWYSGCAPRWIDSMEIDSSRVNTFLANTGLNTSDSYIKETLKKAHQENIKVILDPVQLQSRIARYYDIFDDYPVRDSSDSIISYDLAHEMGWAYDTTAGSLYAVHVRLLYEERKQLHTAVLRVESSDPDFALSFDPKDSTNKNKWRFEHIGYTTPYVSFKIKRDTTYKDEAFRFTTRVFCYKEDTTSRIDTFFVEVNSQESPPLEEGYHNDTITVSLHNQAFFTDVDTSNDSANFPLYDRNIWPYVNLSEPYWQIVFVQLDSIVHHYTAEEPSINTYVFDSIGVSDASENVAPFHFIGRGYYLENFGYGNAKKFKNATEFYGKISE